MRVIPSLLLSVALVGLAGTVNAAPATTHARSDRVAASTTIDLVQYRDYYDDEDFDDDRRDRRQRRDRDRSDSDRFERRESDDRRSERRNRDRDDRRDDRRPEQRRPSRNNGGIDLRDPRYARTCKLLPDSPICDQLRRSR